jgi:homocysteine S-methyltransferase
MNNEIPGCHVPDNIMKRLTNVQDNKEASRMEGIKIAREILTDLTGIIQGVQISAPFGRTESIIEVLDGFVFN